HHAGDVRRRHRGAAVGLVAAADRAGVDVRPRGDEVHAGLAVVRVGRQRPGPVDGGHGQDVVLGVAGRVVGVGVVVGAGVARGGHDDVSVGAGIVDGLLEAVTGPAAHPTVVGDLGPVGDGVLQPGHELRDRPLAVARDEADRHHLDVGVDAG